jgi:glycosyltransferase involved in cell wall biosynthesis
VVVDDGSNDGTFEEAREAASKIPRAVVVRHPQNRGKGAALQTGALQAQGSVVVFLDGDLDLPPGQIPRLLERMDEHDADILVGAKQSGMHEGRYPWKRRALSLLFSFITRTLFRLPVTETQTGLKVFRRAALEAVISELRVFGYAFDLELLVRSHRAGFRIIQEPVELRVGASSQPLRWSTLWEMGRDTVRIFVWSIRRGR